MSQDTRNGWKACPAGEFARLATRLRGRRRRRDVLRATMSVTLAVVVGSVFYQTWSRSREYHFAGISCSRVIALAPDYAMGKLRPELRDQVRRHVSQCPHCKPLFAKMGMVVQRDFQESGGVLAGSIAARKNPASAHSRNQHPRFEPSSSASEPAVAAIRSIARPRHSPS